MEHLMQGCKTERENKVEPKYFMKRDIKEPIRVISRIQKRRRKAHEINALMWEEKEKTIPEKKNKKLHLVKTETRTSPLYHIVNGKQSKEKIQRKPSLPIHLYESNENTYIHG